MKTNLGKCGTERTPWCASSNSRAIEPFLPFECIYFGQAFLPVSAARCPQHRREGCYLRRLWPLRLKLVALLFLALSGKVPN